MNKSSIPLAPQIVREMVGELSTGLAANPEFGTVADKVKMLLSAITAKCALCVCREDGHAGLNAAADCPDSECPLNAYGPSVYKCVRAKLEHQGYLAGGLQ